MNYKPLIEHIMQRKYSQVLECPIWGKEAQGGIQLVFPEPDTIAVEREFSDYIHRNYPCTYHINELHVGNRALTYQFEYPQIGKDYILDCFIIEYDRGNNHAHVKLGKEALDMLMSILDKDIYNQLSQTYGAL